MLSERSAGSFAYALLAVKPRKINGTSAAMLFFMRSDVSRSAFASTIGRRRRLAIAPERPTQGRRVSHPPARQRVVHDQEHRRSDYCNHHAVHIQSSDARHAERVE